MRGSEHGTGSGSSGTDGGGGPSRLLLLLALGAAVALAGCTMNTGGQQGVSCEGSGENRTCTATALRITAAGPTESEAQVLADALGIPVNPRAEDGALRFVDKNRFLRVPSKDAGSVSGLGPNEDQGSTDARALDMQGLAEMEVLGKTQALSKVRTGLDEAGLQPPGGEPRTSHTALEIEPTTSGSNLQAGTYEIDTRVAYELSKNGLPLEGPGAQVNFAFGPDGNATLLYYSVPELQDGPTVDVVPPEDGDDLCRQAYAHQSTKAGAADVSMSVSSEVVYRVPSPDRSSRELALPHFKCSGEIRGENPASLRVRYVPAVKDRPEISLQAQSEGSGENTRIMASASVQGGTAPYEYQWNSQVSTMPSEARSGSSQVEYQVRPRESDVSSDVVTLTVTDANGLTATASTSVSFPCCPPATAADAGGGTAEALAPSSDVGVSSRGSTPSWVNVGTEWIADSQGLSGGDEDADGWVKGHEDHGTDVAWSWGESLAWEEDFKPPSKGGTDDRYADNVDMTYFTGHAAWNGWILHPGHDKKRMTYDNARLGDKEAEWLAVFGCGPFQDGKSPGVFKRWRPAFQGLHLMLGFATTSYEDTKFGKRLAYALHGEDQNLGLSGFGDGPMTVLQSWAYTAIAGQGSDVIHGMMGVVGPDNVWNYEDHFWRHGSTGPDIPKSSQQGAWKVTSAS